MKTVVTLLISAVILAAGCSDGANSQLAAAQSEQKFSTRFVSGEVLGEVVAIHIGGREETLTPSSCEFEFVSYIYGGDPDRAGAYMAINFPNGYGTAGIHSIDLDEYRQDLPPNTPRIPDDFHATASGFNGQEVSYENGTLTVIDEERIVEYGPEGERHYNRKKTAKVEVAADLSKVDSIRFTIQEQKAAADGTSTGGWRELSSLRCEGPFTHKP